MCHDIGERSAENLGTVIDVSDDEATSSENSLGDTVCGSDLDGASCNVWKSRYLDLITCYIWLCSETALQFIYICC